jgi:hypothetical protein
MKQDGLPISGFEAKTAWLKHSFRKLIPEEDDIGTDLTPLENLRGEELAAALKYHSAEAFGDVTMMNWREHVTENQGKSRGRDIVWAYPNQWEFWNKWQRRHEIPYICGSYYSYLLQEGVPLSDFRDTDVAFYFGGRKWVVRPGMVRSVVEKDTEKTAIVVEEVATRKVRKSELKKDWTIAPKLYAVYNMAKQKAFYMKWGAKPQSVSELRYRLYSTSDKRFYETTKDETDMSATLRIVEDVENRIAKGEFEPNHTKCRSCRYNVISPIGKPACSEKNPKVKESKPMEYFEPA